MIGTLALETGFDGAAVAKVEVTVMTLRVESLTRDVEFNAMLEMLAIQLLLLLLLSSVVAATVLLKELELIAGDVLMVIVELARAFCMKGARKPNTRVIKALWLHMKAETLGRTRKM